MPSDCDADSPSLAARSLASAERAKSRKRARRDGESTHDEPVPGMTLYKIGGVPAAIERWSRVWFNSLKEL